VLSLAILASLHQAAPQRSAQQNTALSTEEKVSWKKEVPRWIETPQSQFSRKPSITGATSSSRFKVFKRVAVCCTGMLGVEVSAISCHLLEPSIASVVVGSFFWREECADAADGLPEVVDGSGRGAMEMGFEDCEGHLN
jgi:hypothetical protein